MLHDERYFSNPHSFVPERWIESERGKETCVTTAWIPFSYGKWNCIGKPYSTLGNYELIFRLAMMEMRVTLSRLIWHYDVELKSAGQDVPTYDHLSLASGQLEVRLKKVERD
jgi:cytochrome P450